MKRNERRRRHEQGVQEVHVEHSEPKQTHHSEHKSIYYKEYKKLLIIPMLMLIIALVLIGVKLATTGDFINKGISLKGGTSVTALGENLDSKVIEAQLKSEYPSTEINVRTLENSGQQVGVLIESDILPEDNQTSNAFIESIQKATGIQRDNLSIETIGQTLGDAFFKQTLVAILIAFIFMGVVVYLYFRTAVPSAAVILAAFSDIVVTVAILNILGIKVGTAGIAALLMLIGYSVDTDIVLSTRILKRKEGTVYQRTIGAMKTGLTMNITTLGAVVIGLFIAESAVLHEIMLIVLIGLLVDMVNTWIQNAVILRWHMENKGEI